MIYKVTQRWGVRGGEEGRGGWEGEVGGGKERREERGGGKGDEGVGKHNLHINSTPCLFSFWVTKKIIGWLP